MDKYYELRDASKSFFFQPGYYTYGFVATALEDTITARRSALQIANRLDVKHLADLDVSTYLCTSL
jgi:hypothetical protein